jgi:hypothetical protein
MLNLFAENLLSFLTCRQHIGSRYIEVFKGHPADMQVCVWSLQGGTMFSLQDASYGVVLCFCVFSLE